MNNTMIAVATYSDDKAILTVIADALMQLGVPSVHVSSVQSWYRRKGKRILVDEFKLDVLCTKEMLVDVIAIIKENHSYDAPEIVWDEVNL